jgi:hypothetical protein
LREHLTAGRALSRARPHLGAPCRRQRYGIGPSDALAPRASALRLRSAFTRVRGTKYPLDVGPLGQQTPDPDGFAPAGGPRAHEAPSEGSGPTDAGRPGGHDRIRGPTRGRTVVGSRPCARPPVLTGPRPGLAECRGQGSKVARSTARRDRSASSSRHSSQTGPRAPRGPHPPAVGETGRGPAAP